jgi:hypothetical protein
MTSTYNTLWRFHFPKGKKWFAFREMGNAKNWLPELADGALFAKLLGTGNGSGFSSWPDFSTYMLLVSWRSEADKITFCKSAPFLNYQSQATETTEVVISPIQSHGSWHGSNPFEKQASKPAEKDAAILVLTRARIRPSRLLSFWRRVPSVAKQMTQAKGLLFAKGIGELPLVEQATISIWENGEALQQAAYRKPQHGNVVKDTRKYNWYSEELFARFSIDKIDGTPLF